MKFDISYQPKKAIDKLKFLDEIENNVEHVANVDFDSLVDKELEDRSFVRSIDKEIGKPLQNASGAAQNLRQEIFAEIEQEFLENLNIYGFMVQKGVEENIFPFRDWSLYFKEVEQWEGASFNISPRLVFNVIDSLTEANKDIGMENLASYLSSMKGNIKSLSEFFPNLEKLMKKSFPEVDLLNALSGMETTQIVKAMMGKHYDLKEESDLFFSYAVSIPNPNWLCKKKPPMKGGLEISFSTSNYNEIYEEFAKTEVWQKISEKPELRKRFVKELMGAKLNPHPFYSERETSGGNRYIREVSWDNVNAFINHVSKDDVPLAEYIVERIFFRLSKEEHEKNNAKAIQAINIALHGHLLKEMPVNQVKDKKNKI